MVRKASSKPDAGSAQSSATIACVQHRLNKLDEGVRILIDT
jgi:hypothetical protein